MKRRFTILAMVFAGACAASAKTFPWRITGNDATAARFAAYQGESVAFDVSFSGAASNCTAQSAKIYYQTNGMDRAWWQTDGLVFAPSNDVGAASYRFFIRATDDFGANYTANGVLRMLPSPGFEPAVLAPPVQRLDFANIEVANAPYYTKAETDAAIAAIPGGGVSTNDVLEIVGPTIAAAQADFAATGSVYRAEFANMSNIAESLWKINGAGIFYGDGRWRMYDENDGRYRPIAYLAEIAAALGQFAATGTVATANYATSADSANRLLTYGGVELRFDDGTERWITPALFTPYDEAVAYLSDFSTNNTALVETITAIAGGGQASGLELTDENGVVWTLGIGTNGCIFTYIKEANQ